MRDAAPQLEPARHGEGGGNGQESERGENGERSGVAASAGYPQPGRIAGDGKHETKDQPLSDLVGARGAGKRRFVPELDCQARHRRIETEGQGDLLARREDDAHARAHAGLDHLDNRACVRGDGGCERRGVERAGAQSRPERTGIEDDDPCDRHGAGLAKSAR